MTYQRHPITPPPELVQEWCQQGRNCISKLDALKALATQAARWGADQELRACLELLDINGCPSKWIDMLRAARRPKPPSLKKQALEVLGRVSKDGYPCSHQDDEDWNTIRQALELLPDEVQ